MHIPAGSRLQVAVKTNNYMCLAMYYSVHCVLYRIVQCILYCPKIISYHCLSIGQYDTKTNTFYLTIF